MDLSNLTVPEALTPLLPFIAMIFSRWLSDDGLSARVNAAIAAAFLTITAAACVWLSGNWTGNWTASVTLMLAYVALLMRGDLALLMQFFELSTSPLVKPLGAVPIIGASQSTSTTPAPPAPTTPIADQATMSVPAAPKTWQTLPPRPADNPGPALPPQPGLRLVDTTRIPPITQRSQPVRPQPGGSRPSTGG